MAVDGMWSMTDDGQFELQEPYATYLAEAREAATEGWRTYLYAYLEPRCPYTKEQLNAEMIRRLMERECSANDLLNEFVLEALGGDLIPAGK